MTRTSTPRWAAAPRSSSAVWSDSSYMVRLTLCRALLIRLYTGEKPALGSMISDPACDGPDGTEVDPDPLAALVPESSPPPAPPEVSILQPASASVAVTRTAADRAVTEASTRRGSMWGSLSGGRP